MEKFDKSLSKKDIMERYPIGSYYVNATTYRANPYYKGKPYKVTSHKFLGLQFCGIRYYAEENKGCLFYKGTWAPLCDSEGNVLPEKEKEVSYEIY